MKTKIEKREQTKQNKDMREFVNVTDNVCERQGKVKYRSEGKIHYAPKYRGFPIPEKESKDLSRRSLMSQVFTSLIGK